MAVNSVQPPKRATRRPRWEEVDKHVVRGVVSKDGGVVMLKRKHDDIGELVGGKVLKPDLSLVRPRRGETYEGAILRTVHRLGGKVETLGQAMVRETAEELGVAEEDVTVTGHLFTLRYTSREARDGPRAAMDIFTVTVNGDKKFRINDEEHSGLFIATRESYPNQRIEWKSVLGLELSMGIRSVEV